MCIFPDVHVVGVMVVSRVRPVMASDILDASSCSPSHCKYITYLTLFNKSDIHSILHCLQLAIYQYIYRDSLFIATRLHMSQPRINLSDTSPWS